MRIYFDYNASAPLRAEVRNRLAQVLEREIANPSSVHRAGREGRALLERARAEVAALIGAAPEDVVFTSGGTEANNLAILGVATTRGPAHVVTTPIEHPSVLEPCRKLEARGYPVTYVPVDTEGRVDTDALVAALRPETVMVSVGLANNEVGTVQPVADIARVLRGRGIVLHVDAVQAVGRMSVLVDSMGADLVSLSGHKVGGPQGIGALYVRRGLGLAPILHGGVQEWGRRAGTENVIGAVGFGAAACLAARNAPEESRRQSRLIENLWVGIKATVPVVERNTPRDGVLPNTLNVSFPGAEGDSLLIGLDLCGIALSAGSACAAGSLEPSHVLLAMGRTPDIARSTLRISIGYATTQVEIETFLQALPRVVERCRRMPATEAGA